MKLLKAVSLKFEWILLFADVFEDNFVSLYVSYMFEKLATLSWKIWRKPKLQMSGLRIFLILLSLEVSIPIKSKI